MKLEIFDERKTEKTAKLTLTPCVDGRISLVVVNQGGDILATILTISDSKIILHVGIDPRLGFKLDDKGRIPIAE